MKARRWLATSAAICVLAMAGTASQADAGDGANRTKLFVIAEDAAHEQALMALAGAAAIRMEFESPGNGFTFSGEFTRGQVRALQALGARFEPVEEIFPHVGRQRFGHLSASTADTRDRLRPHARPFCGDGKCSGREDAQSCPADCGETPRCPGPARPSWGEDIKRAQSSTPKVLATRRAIRSPGVMTLARDLK